MWSPPHTRNKPLVHNPLIRQSTIPPFPSPFDIPCSIFLQVIASEARQSHFEPSDLGFILW